MYWEFRRDILTPASHSSLDPSNVERPKLIYNPATRRYVLWAHKENGRDYKEARVVVATSDTIDGNYVYRAEFRRLRHDSRDMTLFVDADRAAYLISATRVNCNLNIYRLDDGVTGVVGLVVVLKGWHREASALFKRDGVHFLVTSSATGWQPNQVAYQTAPAMAGPWTAPIPFGDAKTYNSKLLPVAGRTGTEWLHMGDQWAPAWGGTVNDSTQVWLPLDFRTPTSLAMPGASRITIDVAAGTVVGGAGGVPDIGLRVRSSGLCVAVPNVAPDYGVAIVQAPCGDTADRRLECRSVSGSDRLVFSHSGLCLVQKDDNRTIVQRPCAAGAATQWNIAGETLVNLANWRCLNVADNAWNPGAPLIVYRCGTAPNERWRAN